MKPALSPSGLLLAFAAASLYGVNIGYARLASFVGISATTIIVYRGLAMLLVVAAASLVWRTSLAVPRQERRIIGIIGLATTCIGVLYLSSVAYIPVAVAVVIFYTYPILILFASALLERTWPSPAQVGIAALALCGVVLVVGPAAGALDWRGLALALAASVATAVQFIALARTRATGVVAKMFWIHLLLVPATLLIGFAVGNLAPPAALALAPLAIAVTVGGYVLGLALQFLALARIPAVAAGIVFCAEPVVAALSSTFILDEALTGVQLVGGALVLAAILANILAEGRRAPQDAVVSSA
jgi:drug/metabolite transporter (DMT)-like permease